MEKKILEVIEVSKNFTRIEAVNNVSLEVGAGEVMALIGANGSGKTTLLKMIVGLLKPDEGKVLIGGIDVNERPVEAKAKMGYVPDKPDAYGYLTGYEFLRLTAKMRGVDENNLDKRMEELTKPFALETVLSQRMENYSRGNLQKTAFVAALLAEPELLIIDEPIVGLDPDSIEAFGEMINKFATGGGGVFFATHTLAFADGVATKVGVMKEGKLVMAEKVGKKMKLEDVYQKVNKE